MDARRARIVGDRAKCGSSATLRRWGTENSKADIHCVL
jgi:hypothetical protein